MDSCNYEYELYIHKEGIRMFSVHTDIDQIKNIEEYKDASVHYFTMKNKQCSGICMNSLGEPYVKTFVNEIEF